MHLLFVCTGNTCRSPMAVGIARQAIRERGLNWTVESAGTYAISGAPMAPHAAKTLEKLGIRPIEHRSKPLTEFLMREADIIFTMTSSQAWELRANYPFAFDKIHELGVYATSKGAPLSESCDIVDPVGGSLTTYLECADTLVEFIGITIDKLAQTVSRDADGAHRADNATGDGDGAHPIDGVDGATDGGEKE